MHQEYQKYFALMWTRTKKQKLRILRFAKNVGVNLFREKQKRTKPWDTYAANGVSPPAYVNSDFYKRMKEVIQKIPVYFAFDSIRQIEDNGGNRYREEATVLLGAEHQVQYVYPFLDYRVEDFAVSIPRTLYLKGNRNRYIYREAFRDVMVDELYQYQYKDDPGKGSFFEEHLGLYHQIILKHILPKLNRELWKHYLNFDEVENKLERLSQRRKGNAATEDSLFVMNICRCYRIQRLQELNG